MLKPGLQGILKIKDKAMFHHPFKMILELGSDIVYPEKCGQSEDLW